MTDASGVGTNSATVTFEPANGIPTAGWYFNMHEGNGANTGAGVICGKIAASLGIAAPAAAAPASLPRTGTGGLASNGMLLAVLALVGVALAGTGLALSRRR